MSTFQALQKGLKPQDGCWSTEHRSFARRRELVLTEAERVLGTKVAADQWFVHPARGLEYQPPCSMLSTSQGYRQVRDLLGQIEYGVYI
ncbi:antitoxin Xre/MbcA/ParS toxin-binding domain-containing protein [Pseudomonas sp. NPDC090203]|uniref:antitoxin Xre/MbcA/ParS toxin-binding domain-containing protein n=1 Tax=Pseudomonas sp. NPDC090203 TaxID=3364477 RepID=UPI003824FFDD